MNKPRQANPLFAALGLTAILAGGALAQTADDLKNDHKTPGDVLVYGMGYAGQRYSPLTRINKKNVKTLVPMWAYSITDNRGAEAFPVIRDGVIYTTAHNPTMAVAPLPPSHLSPTIPQYPPTSPP